MAGILVADDDESIRSLLSMHLERVGHTVTAVGDGREVLTKADEGTFDLIILDVVMPEMGGIDALMELRRTNPGVPVIVVTGRARTEAGPFKALLERLNVHCVIDKPFKIDVLLTEVDAALSA